MKRVSLNPFFVYEKIKKKRCWACGFKASIKWGKQNGKQRYKCKNCGVLFTGSNKELKLTNQMVWFKKWIVERLTYRYLVHDSGYSLSSLKRLFKTYLCRTPKVSIKRSQECYLLIDGTYFSNGMCLVLYQDAIIKYTQLYRFSDGERYEQIKEDLGNLKQMDIRVKSITCDGHKAMLKAIREVFPDVVMQRCVVHVHRMANIWLRQKPKTQASIELKRIINLLPLITSHNHRLAFVKELKQWYKHYETFINEKAIHPVTGRWWYKHKWLKRTFTLVSKALPNLFQYLDNQKIPKSTNGLESFFGHLKDSLSIHRGLSYKHRKSFILWYIYFKNQKRE